MKNMYLMVIFSSYSKHVNANPARKYILIIKIHLVLCTRHCVKTLYYCLYFFIITFSGLNVISKAGEETKT